MRGRMEQTGEPLTEENSREPRRLSAVYSERGRDLDAALARLAEVNPELVNG